ncbi:MAG TPA: hypothetical protein VI197_00275 [Polyangiaceae bacterium]
MKRFARTIGWGSLGLSLSAIGLFAACGDNGQKSKKQDPENLGAAGAAGAEFAPPPQTHNAGGSGGTAVHSDDGFTGSNAGAAGAAGAGGAAGAAGAGAQEDLEPECVPTEDEPDGDFSDTNCDGIDGDASRAVFVANEGSDEADGTMEAPVQTLQHAVELASEQDKNVYICNGTYVENVVLEHAVSLYGGYDCENGWHRITDRASIEPEAGVPLSVIGVEDALVVDRLALRAPATAAASESSQAARVANSQGVLFSRVELRAQAGSPGKQGTDGEVIEDSQAPKGDDGADAALAKCQTRYTLDSACQEAADGGVGFTLQCTDPYGVYQNRGGRGGDGANAWLAGASCGDTVDGGAGQAGSPETSSLDGSDGAAAKDGVTSISGFGSIPDGLYRATNTGTNGAPGKRGLPGRGGSGGDSVMWLTNQGFCEGDFSRGGGGGQGGYGGCAGFPGTSGGAGGGSIGLVVINSRFAMDRSTIITGDGGDGGRGGEGSLGQKGGEPGTGGDGSTASGNLSSTNRGQDGGHGGDGSRGGHGGAGAGGPSIGIVVVGYEPVLNDCTFNLGQPGRGGSAVAGAQAADGENVQVYWTPL